MVEHPLDARHPTDLRLVMPFTRWHHLELYRDALRDTGSIWHPVHSLGAWAEKVREEDQELGLYGYKKVQVKEYKWVECFTRFPEESWIVPYVLDRVIEGGGCEPRWTRSGDVMPVWWKLNKFIEETVIDSAWYWFMADDCFWSPGSFDAIRAYIEEREGSKPHEKHRLQAMLVRQRRPRGFVEPTGPAVSFQWDLSMTVVRGSVLKQFRFEERLWYADTYIHEVMGRVGIRFEPVPNAVVYYNALRPEQWGFDVG